MEDVENIQARISYLANEKYLKGLEAERKRILDIILKIEQENSDETMGEYELSEKERYWVYSEELKDRILQKE